MTLMNRFIPGRNTFLLILILLTTGASAQHPVPDSTRGTWCLSLNGSYGFLIAHHANMMPLQEQHLISLSVTASLTTNSTKEWVHEFLHPEKGIKFSAINPGSPDKIGMAYALFPYLDFPLSEKKDWQWWIRCGLGLGYIEKIFEPTENFKNVALGSHLNGVLHFDLHVRKNISRSSLCELGLEFTHFSNGGTAMPNQGINLPSIHAGIRHYFGTPAAHDSPKDTGSIRNAYWSVNVAGSVKEIYPIYGPRYEAATLSATYFHPVSGKSELGAGADLFYDNSLSVKYAEDTGDTLTSVNYRPGLFGAYQLRLGNAGLIFNLGFYPYTKYKGDGNIYQRIGFRYYFNRLYLLTSLKTHYAKADFIEWGIGWRWETKK